MYQRSRERFRDTLHASKSSRGCLRTSMLVIFVNRSPKPDPDQATSIFVLGRVYLPLILELRVIATNHVEYIVEYHAEPPFRPPLRCSYERYAACVTGISAMHTAAVSKPASTLTRQGCSRPCTIYWSTSKEERRSLVSLLEVLFSLYCLPPTSVDFLEHCVEIDLSAFNTRVWNWKKLTS